MSLILSGTDGLSDVDGTAATPAIRGTDANTGIFFPAADTIAFAEGGVECARCDSSGNFGLGVTPSAWNSTEKAVQIINTSYGGGVFASGSNIGTLVGSNAYWSSAGYKRINAFASSVIQFADGQARFLTTATGAADSAITFTQAMTLDASGNLLVGKTSTSFSTNGMNFTAGGLAEFVTTSSTVIAVNRLATDGDLVDFYQAGTKEGAISVSGTTVTYGGGHLARFGQLPDGLEDPTLLKGTVLTNLDEMCVWINKETGIPADNEQCNKVKISDVDGDANVAGVFVSWSYDEQHDTNDLFVAMTGDMIIRIAQGVTVARGDLLMSAGDGTAKPQGDDIVRSKTVAKVTSNYVTCTYADGSYCVPCVLMAC